MNEKATGTSRVAIAALVCGIVGFILLVVPILVKFGITITIAGFICGAIGISQTKGGKMRGRGMAIAGLVLGSLGLVSLIIRIIIEAAGGFGL
jgi:hypothetical protein